MCRLMMPYGMGMPAGGGSGATSRSHGNDCGGFCGNSMTKCQLYQQAARSFRYLVSNWDQATVLGSPSQMVPMRIIPTLLIGLKEISLGLLKDPKLSTLIVPKSL